MQIQIKTAKIGSGYIAATTLGGINVRGDRAGSEVLAIRALLWKLGRSEDDDAAIAVELAVEGTTFGEALGELGTGDGGE